MRQQRLLDYLESQSIISAQEMSRVFHISERTLINDVKELRADGKRHGFTIQRVRGEGYQLAIENQETYEQYKQLFYEDRTIDNRLVRKDQIMVALLFSPTYLTLQQLADTFFTSVHTIKEDLRKIKQDLRKYSLDLLSKSHYGYFVHGKEEEKRRLLIGWVQQPENKQAGSVYWTTLQSSIDSKKFREALSQLLADHCCRVNDVVFEEMVAMIQVTSFRVTAGRKIEPALLKEASGERLKHVVDSVAHYLKEKEQIDLSLNEKEYLITKFYGRLHYESESEEILIKNQVQVKMAQLDQKIRRRLRKIKNLSIS